MFEKRYGIKEDKDTIEFHKRRGMFCIHDDKLIIAKQGLPYSHAVWFEKRGWISKENDQSMNEIIRGMVDAEGNIYFYKGYDFSISDEIESKFLKHLRELMQKLKLRPSASLFGSQIKPKSDSRWLPRKEFGKIKNLTI